MRTSFWWRADGHMRTVAGWRVARQGEQRGADNERQDIEAKGRYRLAGAETEDLEHLL